MRSWVIYNGHMIILYHETWIPEDNVYRVIVEYDKHSYCTTTEQSIHEFDYFVLGEL